MMVDYAGEMGLIKEIKAGKDVHEATGEKLNVNRDLSKNANFGLLYGIGKDAFATLNVNYSTKTASK